jgi:hypothetical protein
MKKMRGLVSILFLVLLSSVVIATSQVVVEAGDNRINLGQRATYNITITNNREVDQTYDFFSSSNGLGWSVVTRPRSDATVTVGGLETRSVEFIVEPIDTFSPGIYLVGMDITSNYGEVYNEQLRVYLGAGGSQEYLPSLRTTIDWDDNVDARETQTIRVVVDNLNPLDLSGTILKVISDIPSLNMEQTVDLKPNSKKTVEFTANIDDTQQPKKYVVFFQFEHGGEVIKVVDKQIEILPLIIPFTKTVEEESSFLKTSRIVTFTNDGNVRNTQEVGYDVGLIGSLFTSSKPGSHIINTDGGRMLGWKIDLGAGEHVSIPMNTNYRIPLVVLVLLIIGVVLYVMYKNPLAITKSASNVVLHEGSLSGLKVTLVVKNLGAKPLRDVHITDEIPSITNIEKEVEMGTLKPTQMLRGRKGRVFVKWTLSELESKEERLISYKIRSTLNIVGTFTLARAKASFLVGGKKRMSYSNSYRVGSEEKSE